MESLKRYAPWTPQQVESLNAYQASGLFHEFTCKCGAALAAEAAGWVCPSCGRTQDWCHAWMADGSWRNMYAPVGAGYLVAADAELRAALAEAARQMDLHNQEYHHRTPPEFIETCRRLAARKGVGG